MRGTINEIQWETGDDVYMHVFPGCIHKVISTSKDPMIIGDCVYKIGKVGKNKKLKNQDIIFMDGLS